MQQKGKIIGLAVLLVIGFAIAPATGSIIEATENQLTSQKTVEIEIWDFTKEHPEKTIHILPQTEWLAIKNEINDYNDKTIEERVTHQINILHQHGLITQPVNIATLKAQAFTEYMNFYKNMDQLPRDSILNNSVISAMCAINFELSNGTTFVLGLNSFINLIGFNIISFHKGYSPTGIEAKGLLTKSTTPGDFLGFMFGFLGYWYGESTENFKYSSLTTAGFTVLTAWFPVPEI
jgi:hypothetical protein